MLLYLCTQLCIENHNYSQSGSVRAIPGKNLNVLKMVLSIQAEVMN